MLNIFKFAHNRPTRGGCVGVWVCGYARLPFVLGIDKEQ